jgi:dienelactone hydrolase
MHRLLWLLVSIACCHGHASAAAYHNPYGKLPTNALAGDRLFAEQFERETRALNEACMAEIKTAQDWAAHRETYRKQLFDMLGLEPLPDKTDLRATITGRIEAEEFTVENLHFQSRPGLYVTANLYVPKGLTHPAPTILYLCGHASVRTNGISYGSKVAYQHHPIWFARHGYICLIIDSVELGEITGQHHGTYREKMWWWNSRGYTAASAEAWNCIRALDYLQTRPEVDMTRIGVTGRSGGGAYSWWLAALDERIKVACPVAGITDLENHVVDGVVEGHCDCMYMVNKYQWDYAQVAALVAPRPLLICNSDKDTIFPLDGVVRLHEQVRRIYDMLGAGDKLGLLITEGPHSDTQDLQLPVFRWFDRWLRNEPRPIERAAVPMFTGEQLRVFQNLPADEVTSRCYESFTSLADDSKAVSADGVKQALVQNTFRAWPKNVEPSQAREIARVRTPQVSCATYEFESMPGLPLRFFEIRPRKGRVTEWRVRILDQRVWDDFSAEWGSVFGEPLARHESAPGFKAEMRPVEDRVGWCFFAPRGVGPTAFTSQEPYATHVHRRFMLLGQTLAGMQVWDLRRCIQALAQRREPLLLEAAPEMVEVAAFAVLFEPSVRRLVLPTAPRPDVQAPDFLNWSRILTPEQLLRLASEGRTIEVGQPLTDWMTR